MSGDWIGDFEVKRITLLLLALAISAIAEPVVPNPPTGLFTLPGPGSPTPSPNSVSAATLTATSNSLCSVATLGAYYWEIGNAAGPIASASVGTPAVLAATPFSIASGSKMAYDAYVAALRGGIAHYTSADINALNFTDGYANMGNSTGGGTAATCPRATVPTINQCLTLSSAQGPFNATYAPAIGVFYYDAGHMENHASNHTSLGNVNYLSLFATMQATMGTTSGFVYSQPTPAEGLYGSANDYTVILRAWLSGAIPNDMFGTNTVCTLPGGNYSLQTVGGVFPGPSNCNALSSPFPETWQYSPAAWVETSPASSGDGAFSSPGAFGFYPWIDSTKTYYGVLSRQTAVPPGGYPSAKCGRLIRHAFMTGCQQTHTFPDINSC